MKNTLEEIFEAIEAFKQDGRIEFRRLDMSRWEETQAPTWNFESFEYRPVQSKLPPKEFWINVYPGSAFGNAYLTKDEAEKNSSGARIDCVHVREVPTWEEEIDRTPWESVDSQILRAGVCLADCDTVREATMLAKLHNQSVGIGQKKDE